MLRFLAATLVLLVALTIPRPASAHCDTTEGPVVTAARAALAAGDPALVLHWVRPEDEAAVRAAFQETMKARALGPAAMAVADRYFFETLVRVHRAGEGAPYLGLKDEAPEPIIAATDAALRSGTPDELEQHLTSAVRAGLAQRFAAARGARDFAPGDVAAGRVFVADYVSLTHWVEGVAAAAGGAGEHHGQPPGATGEHQAAAHQEAAGATGEPRAAAHEEAAPAPTSGADGAGGPGPLPWILAALFGLAALVEGAVLMKQRRHAAA